MKKSFFTDTTGRVIVWQAPNLPLYGWIIFKLAALAVNAGGLRYGLEQLSTIFLFVWAYLELTQGLSRFRQLMGLAVLVVITVGLFK